MKSQNTPLISLVIPTLNRVDSVDRLLESLLSQDFDLSRLEVIVAMNLEDPRQAARLEEWRGRLNVRGVATGRRGVNRARNLGIDQASGDIVFLLDDDMEFRQSDILKRHLEIHADPGVTAVGGGCALPENASLPALAYHLIGLSWMLRYRGADGTTPYLLGGHASYKRRVFDAGARFDENIEFGASETGFNLGLYRAGEKLKYVPEIRPVHHNDVTPRAFLKKAFLQGHNGALRKASVERPRAVIKHEAALVSVTRMERPKIWQKGLLAIYYRLYDWSAQQGRLEALREGALWKAQLIRRFAGIR